MEIKDSIRYALSISFVALLFLFSFTWIVFDFSNSSSSLKDTWSILSSIFGGFATLTAAYIASLLFNDWKEQHNKIIESNSATEVINSILETKVQLRFIRVLLDKSEINNHMINNEISRMLDNFINNSISFQEKLEFFNLLIKKNPKKYDEFLSKCDAIVNSFGNIAKFTSATQNMYIENSQKFIILVDEYIIECDNFCNSLIDFVKAN